MITSQLAEVVRLARECAADDMPCHRAAENINRSESAVSTAEDQLRETSERLSNLTRAFDALDTYGGGVPATSEAT